MGAQITLDGPPETHNLMRPPRAAARRSRAILENIEAAAEDILPIAVRVNLDATNVAAADSLLDLLVYPGSRWADLVCTPARSWAYDEGIGAPSERLRARRASRIP